MLIEELFQVLQSDCGIEYFCLWRGQKQIASSFPEHFNNDLAALAKLLQKLHKAAAGYDFNYREVQLELVDSLLLGFALNDSDYLLVEAEKDLNFALISATVRALCQELVEAIEQQLPVVKAQTKSKASVENIVELSQEAEQQQNLQVGKAVVGDTLVTGISTHAQPVERRGHSGFEAQVIADIQQGGAEQANQSNLNSLLSDIRATFADYAGPSAERIFGNAYLQWRDRHGNDINKIAQLIKRVGFEIKDDDKRRDFTSHTVQLARLFITRQV